MATEKGAEPRKDRPNVLLICVDDLKPIAGCYGGTAKTPHLDRLAARGVLFERAYCNQAVCAPSRNALLTGLRPQTLGIYDLGTNFRQARPDAITLPQHFKQHGWRTEALGKIFHVGHGNHEDPASWSAPHWRANVVAYALPKSRAKKGLTREEALFSNKPAGSLPRGAAYEAADVSDNAYPDGAMADEVVRRLSAMKDKPSEPFFLAVGFVKPHLPFCAPTKYWDLYNRDDFALPAPRMPPKGAPRYAPTNWGELRQYRGIPQTGPLSNEQQSTLIHGYHAAVSYMDAQLGRVLDALDENQLAKNTIVVLWGDHGWHLGDHGMWCKHSNYEQAARIPLIVMAPGAGVGERSAALVESVDIYPTLCDLAGLPAPKDLDGVSFAATLRQPATIVKQAAFHVYPRGERMGRAVRTQRHRLVEWKVPGAPAETAELELYDYETDAAETANVAAMQPETVAQLRGILDQQAEARPQIAGGGQNAGKAASKRREASKERAAEKKSSKELNHQRSKDNAPGVERNGAFEASLVEPVAKARESGGSAFPLKVSENRRYLVDQRGRPFFFHADTAWQLPKRLKREDLEAYLDDRKARGFTAVLIQAFSKEVTPLASAYGETPFDEAENILNPNEAYWRHVDFVVEAAARRGLAVAMAPLWIRWGGDDRHGWRNHLTDENARPYGEFVGRRYARFDNLLWILGGDANPKEKTEAIRSLARGIKAHAPDQLIMVHNAPEHPSATFFGDDDWLDVNMAYSYKEVYPQILGEWTNTACVRPILLGESGYEEESNDGRGGAPWRVRRQAYEALLAGALGGHAFGQKHIWRFDDEWRKALDSPGSRQMTHVKALFASRPWHRLEPDHANTLVVHGQGKKAELEYVVAARASDGSFALVYFPTTLTVKLKLTELGKAPTARWFDPTNGKSQTIEDFAVDEASTASITPPKTNSAGDTDWVLVLDAMPAHADDQTSHGRPSIEIAKTAEAVILKNDSGRTLLSYQLKSGADKKLSVESACYFHPFATPAGQIVTEVAPDDHRHHRGIFLAFVEMHGEKDADFWGWGEHAPKDDRVIVNRSVVAGQNKNPGLVAQNDWTAGGTVMIKETLAAALSQPDGRANQLDLQYTLTLSADIVLSRWAFSGFCVRTRKDAELTAFGPQGEVKLPNPSHVKPESDWPAEPWYAYELRLKDGETFGVAVIDHPKNPPALWHNHRDVRMLNPSIVAPGDVKLRAREPVVLRYRVVAYDGRTPSDQLDRLASQFAENQ